MTVIDPTTNLGKLRLRVADFGDIVYLPDSVYLQTLVDTNNNLTQSAKTCALYILGTLSFRVHRKMGLQLEVFNGEAFEHYKEFLLLTVTNPAFMTISPVALQSTTTSNRNVLQEFVTEWNENYYRGTQSQEMALDADIGPNDGSRLGPLGSLSTIAADGTVTGSGWVLP